MWPFVLLAFTVFLASSRFYRGSWENRSDAGMTAFVPWGCGRTLAKFGAGAALLRPARPLVLGRSDRAIAGLYLVTSKGGYTTTILL